MHYFQKLINEYDKENLFQVLMDTYEQVVAVQNAPCNVAALTGKSYSHVLISGLGGSAIAGDLLKNLLGSQLKVPVTVNRGYQLPESVHNNTLVILSSYSGETEETLSVMQACKKRGIPFAAISSGGTLAASVTATDGLLTVPKGFQPRFAVGLSLFAQIRILAETGVVGDQSGLFLKAKQLLEQKSAVYASDQGKPFKIAEDLIGVIPIIYSAVDTTEAIGYRLKCQFNENSKLLAFHAVIPEMNHNEIVGWETFSPQLLHAKVLMLGDRDDHPQTAKRFAICSDIMKKAGAEVITITSDEEDYESRFLDLLYLTDWISYYLCLFRARSPIEIDNIHFLKKALVQ